MSRRCIRAASRAFAALAAPMVCAPPASAAEIEQVSIGDGIELIAIQGDIAPGDEEKFRALSIKLDDALVALSSDGGSLLTAIEIGKMIRLKEYPTLVVDDYECISACALIWVAGSTRYIAPGGRVGFHASYRDEGGRKVETGLGNALVGRYLTLLNLPEKAVLFATAAPPDSVLWLTADNMGEAGIEFEIFGETGDVSPSTTGLPRSQVSAASPAVRRSGWEEFGRAESAIYYLDWDSIHELGGYLAAWQRVDHSQDATVSYYEAKNLWLYDCDARRMALKAMTTYDRNGIVEDSFDLEARDIEWQPAIPDSIGESALDLVCR